MGKKILIVDDSKFMRFRLKACLHQAGLDTVEAKNGKEGLEQIPLETPDLIISDVNMPVMDGPEFIRNVFRLYPDIPIIVLTANPDRELKFDFMSFNVRAFISKLHPIEKIADRVIQVLDRTG